MDCLTPDSWAAVALKMQATALEAEERIYAAEQSLRAVVNPPTIVQTSTALITGIPADGTDYSIGPSGGGTFATDFNNTGVDGFIDMSSTQITEALGEGLYEIGMSATVVASGVVNDNSFRYFKIGIFRRDPSALLGISEVMESSLLLFESNTGVGVSGCLVGHFRLLPGDQIRFTVQHTNLGSTLNASVGNRIWLTKLSDASVLEVL